MESRDSFNTDSDKSSRKRPRLELVTMNSSSTSNGSTNGTSNACLPFNIPFSAPAKSTIKFNLLNLANDANLKESHSFQPEYTHQLFDEETINGYRNLSVTLNFLPCSMQCLLEINFGEKATDGPVDDVEEILASWVKIDYTLPPCTYDDFKAKLQYEAALKPFGDTIKTFTHKSREYKITFATLADEEFMKFHERLEAFVVFFINGASKLTEKQNRWHCFLLYEIVKVDDQMAHQIIGFSTAFHFFQFPNKIRPRISQFLILPPFQRQGLGQKFLHAIYESYQNNAEVKEITVEDPSEEFTGLRDVVEIEMMQVYLTANEITNFEQLDFKCETVQNIRVTLKIAEVRFRRVYEILKLIITKQLDHDLKAFRTEILRRINFELSKEERFKKTTLSKSLIPKEAQVKIELENAEEKYRELFEDYMSVVKKFLKRDVK